MYQSAKELALKCAKKVQNFVIDNTTGAVTAVGTSVALASTQVMAAIPASVTTGITESLADIATIGGLVLGVVIAVVGFIWIRKPIR